MLESSPLISIAPGDDPRLVGGWDGLNNVAFSGTPTVQQVNEVTGFTTGIVTATIAPGTASSLAGLIGSGNIYTISIFAGSAAASDLNAIDSVTTVVVDASAVTTVTGSATEITTAYGSSGITGLGNEALSVTDLSISVTDVNALDSKTTGVVTASISSGIASTLAASLSVV